MRYKNRPRLLHCTWHVRPRYYHPQDAVQIFLRNLDLLLEHQHRRCSRQVSAAFPTTTKLILPRSEHASNSISNSSNATIPASTVSLVSDVSMSIYTASADTTSASADTTSASGAFASAEAALNSALSVATAAAASYVSDLPTTMLFGATDPTAAPGEQNSGATRRVTASMMGVGVVLVVALVL